MEFFSNKIAVLRASLEVKLSTIIQSTVEDVTPCQFHLSHFKQVTSSDVLKLISASVIKSCPLDPVPASVFKQCSSVLVPVITVIINKSIHSGVVPDCFKAALLKPLLKKAHIDSEVYANFRPISNLIYVSKLTEKVVAKQLIQHVSSNGLYKVFQSAYKNFHSTETALVKVYNDILVDIDKNRTIILLLLDLSAAFDTVDHEILPYRLASRFGISDVALSWFGSYLSNRSQFVNVRGAQSEAHSLPCGVPQGSVLGPVLYLLYTSPLGDIVRCYNMGFHFYADDTQLYLSFNTLNEEDRVCTVAQVESCVRDIDHWMASNRLKLNNDKTELLVISSKYQL